MSRLKLYGILALTVTLFPAIAWLIDTITGSTYLQDSIRPDSPIVYQMLLGIVYGFFTGYLAVRMIRRPSMEPTLTRFTRGFQLSRFKKRDFIAIGLAAGIGEELLFRTTVQGHLGIWITAIVFVAIHGYLNPKNWPLTSYGIVMVVIVAGMGWLKDYFGLYSAITAHALIDVIILLSMYKLPVENSAPKDPMELITFEEVSEKQENSQR